MTVLENPPTRRRQADRRADAEERLVGAAIELIARRGVEGLRLAELGAVAGFSRALPAHYFGQKENLIRVIVRRIIDQHYRNTRQQPSDAPGVGHAIALAEAYVRAMKDRRSNIVALHAIFASAAINDDLRSIVQSLNQESTQAVKAALDTAVELGEVAPDTDTRVEALSLLAFLRGVGSLYLVDANLPISEMASNYLQSMLQRIASV